MPSMDVFSGDAFSLRSLTDAIIKAPYKPGRIGQLGLFRERGIATTTITIEQRDGQLSIIPTSQRGGPGSSVGKPSRRAYPFNIVHLQREATVLADEVQNVRAFGSQDATQGVQELINDRMADLRSMHEVTLERLRLGAIKGQLLDADNSVLLDLFTAFGVSQTTAQISHFNGETRNSIVAALRAVELALGADAMVITGFRAFCGDTFFDTLIQLDDVVSSLQYQESIQLRSDLRSGFQFGGVTWENYKGRIKPSSSDGDTTLGQPFIAADEAYIVPEGAPIFQTYFGPADFADTVNTIGLPLYARIAVDPEFSRFAKIHTQSNPLPLNLRPEAVCKVTFGS